MIHTSSDPLVAQLMQLALHEQGLYGGKIDGEWGPVSEAAFTAYAAENSYAGAALLKLTMTADQQADLAIFLKNWKDAVPRGKYDLVAKEADVPAELVAALHYRECPDFPAFGTYLHNGDPLGQPTTDAPAGILFTSWVTAAIDAIMRETGARAASGVDFECRSLAALCVYAEFYNGEGYRDHGVPDPYVLSGTSAYTKGKFSADGQYDPDEVYAECGVAVLLRGLGVGNPI